jgi:DNA-binding SARP family transcriptional activator
MAPVVEFRVLGPVEAVVEGRPAALPAAKPRALLAVLLLSRNRVVPVGELIAELWGDEPPETAQKALQVYVSQLRKVLGSDRVVTKAPGYLLRVEEGELDLDRFERLVREGRERLGEGDAGAAAATLEEALALWRGPAPAERLEESRLAALEERLEAELELGRHGRIVPELEELVARHPLRERLRGQLMLALYRSGRQAEALELFRRTRETLVEELGIEPSPALQELERAILRHDPDLRRAERRAPARAAAAAAPPRAARWRLLVLGLLLVAAAVTAAALALTRGGSGNTEADLRPFVVKLENFLTQSSDGRREVAGTIGAALNCSLPSRDAVVRLNRVQRNRQSLLQQLAALAVPRHDEALRASDLLQKATQASIAADWHYRDWLLVRKGCTQAGEEFDAARAADGRATQAKRDFLAVFNPLARRFHQRVWTAEDF